MGILSDRFWVGTTIDEISGYLSLFLESVSIGAVGVLQVFLGLLYIFRTSCYMCFIRNGSSLFHKFNIVP